MERHKHKTICLPFLIDVSDVYDEWKCIGISQAGRNNYKSARRIMIETLRLRAVQNICQENNDKCREQKLFMFLIFILMLFTILSLSSCNYFYFNTLLLLFSCSYPCNDNDNDYGNNNDDDYDYGDDNK
ncbi:hypothetical protein LOAG_06907 [Loa loa]|uniref:Uncharacterized protein n=1 Tax=Loa loa TaxID=7209 RepID=A0A1S0TWR2_LOALO|nr:hypothetical protein LOAG_06907 [Loa loa]EFO21577.1 hypothetical protein LOAG_06907 [Loa loa]